MKIVIRLTMFLTLCSLFAVENGFAIPTYARQYKLSCSACHSPVPKLTPFGDQFAANGFQLEGLAPPEAIVQTDDASLSLMREFPIAVRFDGFARILPDENRKTDFEWPFVMKIFSSGQIKSDISYFFYFLMNEGGSIVGVEDAFLYFNDIAGQKLDVTVGQFQVADMIFKRELRPTFEDYQIYEARPGLSKADLTYDRGLIVNYTLPSQTDFFLTVLNGNGIGESSDGLYDDDPYKNFCARIAQPIGSEMTIGALGYLGKESISDNINQFSMLGGDVTLNLDKLELLGQFVHRHDDNPLFLSGTDSPVNTNGGFAQLMYSPAAEKSDWYMFLLYNNVHSDLDELKYQSVAGNFTYLLSRNFKLTGEYGYDFERSKHSFTFGFMTAF